MDDFKFVTLFLVLGITISVIMPVQSAYGVFQPQYFQIQSLQQPYNPYPYYDIYRLNHGVKTDPSPAYQPGYPLNPQPQVPTVYSYYGTPVYDFRYPPVPFYHRGRPIFPPSPLPPLPEPLDPSSTDKPDKSGDDGLEKFDNHKADNKKNKKPPQKPEESKDTSESTETTTEPSEDTITVNALPE